MKLPTEVAVMTLPDAILFPQALLPLYIFEPRYRQMLADVLQSDRMFAIAMQRPGHMREVPAPVAGLGVVRVCVGHKDGTSHLVLQGLVRVELKETLRYRPYRLQRIRVLETPPAQAGVVDELVGRVRQLLAERLKLGLPFPFPSPANPDAGENAPPASPEFVAQDMLEYVNSLKNPEFVADLVSCAVLRGAERRQTILETLDIEKRLRRLVLFLETEIKEHQDPKYE